ncbi:hypothetical protein AQPE_2006 [Aquipluma nitroreducens]|uniref:Uncharacterized protein n=1 Tax=Aquipluma nitroreducens TaxID=2010828 RepID=A0A5K7S8M3_9BACT|nr:hypothetical protein [Aquipluma nitroreducens]BBE17847.1 hypothetical protein AQPE_2006 [Aquipluma nitroreducens]
MNFKLYDILSSLVPGFLLLLVILEFFNLSFDNKLVVPYTAIAFLFGYLVNTISSWLEDIYFFTWKGKPSDCLLNGKDIWKVRFYESQKANELLKAETTKSDPTNDELFSIAMRYANQKDSRVEDFNSSYAFSRSLLTCVLIGGIFLLIRNYNDLKFYLLIIPAIIIVWLRCKQRGYYFSREVLLVYLKNKNS